MDGGVTIFAQCINLQHETGKVYFKHRLREVNEMAHGVARFFFDIKFLTNGMIISLALSFNSPWTMCLLDDR